MDWERRIAGARVLLRIWRARVWLVLQTTIAGTTAWVVADQLDYGTVPFFAPVTAVLVLNSARGERARDALRLLLGVLIGISCAEMTMVTLGGGASSLAVATFSAMAIVALFSRTRLMINQAGVSAILTVVLAAGDAGTDRMLDALIGAAVAVIFTQVIFSPEPVALIRRAESEALGRLAEGLAITADALTRAADVPPQPDLALVKRIRDALAEVARSRVNSKGVVQRGLIWRHRQARLPPMIENASQLELLGASCLLLMRTAALAESQIRQQLATYLQVLARTLENLGADPGDRATRQAAVNRALRLAREATDIDGTPAHVPAAAVQTSLLMVVYDILLFAGVASEKARTAMREDTDELPVVGLPTTVTFPFWPNRRS